MNTAFHQDFVWCLRALSQNATEQRTLYPGFVHLADELALDFDEALSVAGRDILERNPDLAAPDALIEPKSGISAYWSVEALEGYAFWQEVQSRARKTLADRGLPATTPGEPPSGMHYVDGKTGWRDRVVAWSKRKT